MQTRRDFTKQSFQTLMMASFAALVWQKRALGGSPAHELESWVKNVNSISHDLQTQKLGPLEGQRVLEAFYKNVSIPDFLKFIDFDTLTSDISYPRRGEKFRRVTFPAIEGQPEEPLFHADIVALKKGRSIAPHGHDNMVTSFFILKGSFHGRHFDRKDFGLDLILTPTIDHKFTPGQTSSISDQKDNVHWYTALSETAFLFDAGVMDTKSRPQAKIERVHLDLRHGTRADGTIVAKRVSRGDCYELYG